MASGSSQYLATVERDFISFFTMKVKGVGAGDVHCTRVLRKIVDEAVRGRVACRGHGLP